MPPNIHHNARSRAAATLNLYDDAVVDDHHQKKKEGAAELAAHRLMADLAFDSGSSSREDNHHHHGGLKTHGVPNSDQSKNNYWAEESTIPVPNHMRRSHLSTDEEDEDDDEEEEDSSSSSEEEEEEVPTIDDSEEESVELVPHRRPTDITNASDHTLGISNGTGRSGSDNNNDDSDVVKKATDQFRRKGLVRQKSVDLEDALFDMDREKNRRKQKRRRNRLKKKKKPPTSGALPESIAWRVTRSWELVSHKTEQVGVDFFLRLFEELPQAADLFKFGGSVDNFERDPKTGKFLLGNKKPPKALSVHAKKVLDTVGVCVAGLSHLPDLVPTLRSLGKFHTSVGVQSFHYDAIYVHLLDALEAEIGPEKFDSETRESWEIVYRSLTTVMKNPDNVLQMEPLEGWGKVATTACAFLTIATPLQMSYLTASNKSLQHQLHFGTLVAAVILALDMSSHWLAEYVRPRGVPEADPFTKSYARRRLELLLFPLKFRAIRFLRSLQMDRWAQWQKMEAAVLLSFPLQYGHTFLNQYVNNNNLTNPSFPENDVSVNAVGVHWTFAFGLLRLVAVYRVYHAFQCAENNFLLRQKKSTAQEMSTWRMIKLVGTMVLVIHINAALWCLVARIELGYGQPAAESSFFPLAVPIFTGQLSTLNSYLHAVHWAWVNLAGIGDDDSKPETSLECMITLFVHICGATLYTITTGNVVNILESMSEKRNEVGGDLAELGQFMQTCQVPQDIQYRIMQGYMMKKMIGDQGGDLPEAANAVLKEPEAVHRLPRHLESEVTLYFRAEAIRRRDAAFAHCSHEFLVAFVASLNEPDVVLPEEDYIEEGEPLLPQVTLLVEGEMQVLKDDICVRHLLPGDLIGKNHLFLENDRVTDRVGLRAATRCTIVTGLTTEASVELLQGRFKRDFSLLEAYRRHGQVAQAGMSDLSFTRNSISLSQPDPSMQMMPRSNSMTFLQGNQSFMAGSNWNF